MTTTASLTVGTDSSAFSGEGALVKTGMGTLTLRGLNAYSGATIVAKGTLKAGVANALSAASAFTVVNGAILDLDGYSQTVVGLTNNGVVRTGSEDSENSAGTVLTVNGDYQGNSGDLYLRTVLDDDTSATDKLHVTGNTSGYTNVAITNLGGSMAQTINGIEIVAVDGNSDGTFDNSQRIVAGAYDYSVRSGKTIDEANDNNWYLISEITPAAPDPDPDPDPNPNPDKSTPVYRPEAGGYLTNLAASNTLFITRLDDRIGVTGYTDTLNGEEKTTSVWTHHAVNSNSFRDNSEQLKTSGNSYGMQIGGDLAQWSGNGSDRWHLGAMGGYARNNSKSRSEVTGYSAKDTVSGYIEGRLNDRLYIWTNVGHQFGGDSYSNTTGTLGLKYSF